MAEEEEAIVLDVIPDRSLPGEDGTAQNGVNVPGHEHLPPVPLPSPTSSSDGEKNKKKGKTGKEPKEALTRDVHHH